MLRVTQVLPGARGPRGSLPLPEPIDVPAERAARRRRRHAVLRRLRRADQAADHRAAAGHHGAGDGPGRARPAAAGGSSLATLVGGSLAAGSANALNCYLDRDIDAVMRRTERRPLARHAVSPRAALVFGIVLGAVAIAIWLATTGWLPAALTAVAILFYVFVYTLVLKRRTAQNIVWGGAAGCMPVLIGWAAVTGSLAWAAGRAVRASCSSGPRRTSGRWRCGSRTTTPGPACRCCRWSPRRCRWPAGSSATPG